jgi:hypothetical protein
VRAREHVATGPRRPEPPAGAYHMLTGSNAVTVAQRACAGRSVDADRVAPTCEELGLGEDDELRDAGR